MLRSLHRFPVSVAPGEHEVVRLRRVEHVRCQRSRHRIGAEDEHLPPVQELVHPKLVLLNLVMILLLRPARITAGAHSAELWMIFEVAV